MQKQCNVQELSSMETLLKKNRSLVTHISDDKNPDKIIEWHPKLIKEHRDSLSIDKHNNYNYAMQYLEFLELQMEELVLPLVVLKMVYKTYIINAGAIIELLLLRLVEDKQLLADLKNYKKLKKIRKKDNNFGVLIGYVGHKKLLSNTSMMDKIRKLRNYIHIDESQKNRETDYRAFVLPHVQGARKCLYELLEELDFCTDIEPAEFLKEKHDYWSKAENKNVLNPQMLRIDSSQFL